MLNLALVNDRKFTYMLSLNQIWKRTFVSQEILLQTHLCRLSGAFCGLEVSASLSRTQSCKELTFII
jgi:hypothetical protein